MKKVATKVNKDNSLIKKKECVDGTKQYHHPYVVGGKMNGLGHYRGMPESWVKVTITLPPHP